VINVENVIPPSMDILYFPFPRVWSWQDKSSAVFLQCGQDHWNAYRCTAGDLAADAFFNRLQRCIIRRNMEISHDQVNYALHFCGFIYIIRLEMRGVNSWTWITFNCRPFTLISNEKTSITAFVADCSPKGK